MKHLIFYDGTCPLCHRAIRFILGADRKKLFAFASLEGSTAHKELKEWKSAHPQEDTLVLLEDYQTAHPHLWIEGRAILKICWLLGGKYRLLGWMAFLPPPLFNLAYRWVARRRYRLFSGPLPSPEFLSGERFLP